MGQAFLTEFFLKNSNYQSDSTIQIKFHIKYL